MVTERAFKTCIWNKRHVLQQPPLSMDRVEKLVESLNKAREHSEQYARCRLELREVENENEPPVTSSFSKGTSAINAAINALKEKESGQILSTALSNSAADRVLSSIITTGDEPTRSVSCFRSVPLHLTLQRA